ncbi:MAG: nucleotidyl transferase AbiEii/AbiGii toxin family protein [Bryobacteraceae bacterium]|nr:nucleotidyl transferase AbiEii/AbiGii toxin family protein [Bryobacteraceae bacterium]
MSNTYNQPSVNLAKPVDTVTAHILRGVSKAATVLKIDFFVAGAMARDIVLVNVWGQAPGRATRDIDLGVAVEDWVQFDLLKAGLCEQREFRVVPKISHRLLYSAGEAFPDLPIDLIPFGGVADAGGQITWPPKDEVIMSVAGFRDAQRSALPIRIEEHLIVPVASLAGLVILKLLAWDDRRMETNKDALDLCRVLSTYDRAGNEDRLFEQELPLLEDTGFDIPLAAARLLGRDSSALCGPDVRHRIVALLQSQERMEQLVNQMASRGWLGDDERSLDYASLCVDKFRQGFLESETTAP